MSGGFHFKVLAFFPGASTNAADAPFFSVG